MIKIELTETTKHGGKTLPCAKMWMSGCAASNICSIRDIRVSVYIGIRLLDKMKGKNGKKEEHRATKKM